MSLCSWLYKIICGDVPSKDEKVSIPSKLDQYNKEEKRFEEFLKSCESKGCENKNILVAIVSGYYHEKKNEKHWSDDTQKKSLIDIELVNEYSS